MSAAADTRPGRGPGSWVLGLLLLVGVGVATSLALRWALAAGTDEPARRAAPDGDRRVADAGEAPPLREGFAACEGALLAGADVEHSARLLAALLLDAARAPGFRTSEHLHGWRVLRRGLGQGLLLVDAWNGELESELTVFRSGAALAPGSASTPEPASLTLHGDWSDGRLRAVWLRLDYPAEPRPTPALALERVGDSVAGRALTLRPDRSPDGARRRLSTTFVRALPERESARAFALLAGSLREIHGLRAP